jgi:hypothetical protein
VRQPAFASQSQKQAASKLAPPYITVSTDSPVIHLSVRLRPLAQSLGVKATPEMENTYEEHARCGHRRYHDDARSRIRKRSRWQQCWQPPFAFNTFVSRPGCLLAPLALSSPPLLVEIWVSSLPLVVIQQEVRRLSRRTSCLHYLPTDSKSKNFGNLSLLSGKPLRVGNRHCRWCWRAGGAAKINKKAERLGEHIVWAAQHGGLDAAESFLRGLATERWHHSNPSKPNY